MDKKPWWQCWYTFNHLELATKPASFGLLSDTAPFVIRLDLHCVNSFIKMGGVVIGKVFFFGGGALCRWGERVSVYCCPQCFYKKSLEFWNFAAFLIQFGPVFGCPAPTRLSKYTTEALSIACDSQTAKALTAKSRYGNSLEHWLKRVGKSWSCALPDLHYV